MLLFVLGVLLGGVIGVGIMCCLHISDRTHIEEYQECPEEYPEECEDNVYL